MSYTPMQLAESFIKAGELPDALDALNAHLTDNPHDDDALRLRASVTLRQGNPRAALDDLNALTAPTPPDAYSRSVVLAALDDLPAALEAARHAHATADEPAFGGRALGRVLDLLRTSGDLTGALALALEHDWVQWAADAAAALDDPQAANTYYTQALDRTERLFDVTSDVIAANIKARVLLKRAGTFVALGDDPAADADYQAAAAIIPDDPMIAFNRALIAARRNDTSQALVLLGETYTHAPQQLRQMMEAELRASQQYAPLLNALGLSNDHA
jgi:tetratricopeptide (TPR) repeat protein